MKKIILILPWMFILFVNSSSAVPAPQEMIDEINKKLFANTTGEFKAVDKANFDDYVDKIKQGLPLPDSLLNNAPLPDDILLTKLQSTNLQDRQEASKVIKYRGFRNKDLFIAVFQKILSEDDFQVRTNILDGLRKRILGLRYLEATAPIANTDSEYDKKVRSSINPDELSQLNVFSASIIKNLRVQDPVLRASSVYTFITLNPNGYNEILDLINDPAKEVRFAVISSFAEIANIHLQDPSVMKNLVGNLSNTAINKIIDQSKVETENEVKAAISRTLARTTKENQAVLNFLIQALSEPDLNIRRAARKGLLIQGSFAFPALKKLQDSLSNINILEDEKKEIESLINRIKATDSPPVITLKNPLIRISKVDGKLKLIKLSYNVTDDSKSTPVCSLKVASSEKVRGKNFGTSSPDWLVVNPTTVKVRSESYNKKGRTYKVNINCTDKVKNVSSSLVSILVKRKK